MWWQLFRIEQVTDYSQLITPLFRNVSKKLAFWIFPQFSEKLSQVQHKKQSDLSERKPEEENSVIPPAWQITLKK